MFEEPPKGMLSGVSRCAGGLARWPLMGLACGLLADLLLLLFLRPSGCVGSGRRDPVSVHRDTLVWMGSLNCGLGSRLRLDAEPACGGVWAAA
jgi:hypothetical protein